MRKGKSYLLVVDASVARAAGETNHPVSSSCREALESILRICHRIIMGYTLSVEWKNHESRFAKRWLVSMYARRKVITIDSTSFPVLVEKAITLTDREREALEKDKHLVELAIDGDGVIYSIDDTAIEIWDKCCKQMNTPKEITWKNPIRESPSEL